MKNDLFIMLKQLINLLVLHFCLTSEFYKQIKSSTETKPICGHATVYVITWNANFYKSYCPIKIKTVSMVH